MLFDYFCTYLYTIEEVNKIKKNMTLEIINSIDVCSLTIETLNNKVDFYHSVVTQPSICNTTLFIGTEQSYFDSLTTLDTSKKLVLWNNHQYMRGLKFGLMDSIEQLEIKKPRLSSLLQDRIDRLKIDKSTCFNRYPYSQL